MKLPFFGANANLPLSSALKELILISIDISLPLNALDVDHLGAISGAVFYLFLEK